MAVQLYGPLSDDNYEDVAMVQAVRARVHAQLQHITAIELAQGLAAYDWVQNILSAQVGLGIMWWQQEWLQE